MKAKLVVSKTGKTYRNYYVRRDKIVSGVFPPPKVYQGRGQPTISKLGKYYINYYVKMGTINGIPLGEARWSHLNALKVLERDGFRCQLCGSTRNLNAHHIDEEGPHKVSKPNNRLDNLKTLCHRCNTRLHYRVLGKAEAIKRLRKVGMTLEVIGERYGVSRQRIFEILRIEVIHESYIC